MDAGRVTFKYGLGNEFIDVLRTLHLIGLDGTDPLDVRGTKVYRLYPGLPEALPPGGPHLAPTGVSNDVPRKAICLHKPA